MKKFIFIVSSLFLFTGCQFILNPAGYFNGKYPDTWGSKKSEEVWDQCMNEASEKYPEDITKNNEYWRECVNSRDHFWYALF